MPKPADWSLMRRYTLEVIVAASTQGHSRMPYLVPKPAGWSLTKRYTLQVNLVDAVQKRAGW
jgi:hypothetical protein